MEFRGKGRGKPWNSMEKAVEKAVESHGIPWKWKIRTDIQAHSVGQGRCNGSNMSLYQD